jgi:hypothetical protein
LFDLHDGIGPYIRIVRGYVRLDFLDLRSQAAFIHAHSVEDLLPILQKFLSTTLLNFGLFKLTENLLFSCESSLERNF